MDEEETKEPADLGEVVQQRSPSMTDCVPGQAHQQAEASDLDPIPFALAGQGLPPLIEGEIQKLLGNIKVRTSSIKETLKKQKDVIISDSKPGEAESEAEEPQKDIEAVDFGDCSVILDKEVPVDEEANSELNTTVIRTGENATDDASSTVSLADVAVDVSQSDILPPTDLEEKKEALEATQQEEAENAAAEVKPIDLTEASLKMPQVEAILSEVKTRHIAEKRLLQCDLMLLKKVV